MQAQTSFAGREVQALEHMSLATKNFQAEFDTGSLNINAALSASREDEKVTIMLPTSAEFELHDAGGYIRELLTTAVPGMQLIPQKETAAFAVIDSGSSFVIRTGSIPSMIFSGDAKFKTHSAKSNISAQANDLQIEIEDFSGLDTIVANGLMTLDWIENAPFTYYF